ncbi:MAG: VOC family protein [Pyrinomonadaceae bacterium]|jgi:hypothetical protein|nr:VOC family protein [Pyrinomonadaceae bacterium]
MAQATEQEMTMPKQGEFCWTEIGITDLNKCKNFYTNVFGWEFVKSNATMENFEYAEFQIENSFPMGGMYEITQEMFGEDMPPPHFLQYIAVDNVDEITSKAFDLGAKIIKPAEDIPNVGRFSMIEDPAGAKIAFLTIGGQSE